MLRADQWMGKLLRLPRKLIPKEAPVRILRGPLRGFRWLTGTGPEGWWLGLSEQEKLRFVAKVIAKDSVFCDVGANVGLYAMLAASKTGPAGRVFAFEPAARNCAFFREHMRMNHLSNVFLSQYAIGASDGEVSFDDSGDPVGFRVSDTGRTSVRLRSIDSLVESKEMPAPHYLKIDVEGAEMDVLKGAAKTIENHRPDVFIETHNRFVPGVHEACAEWLRQRGYSVAEFGGDEPPTEIYATTKARSGGG
jgi:FkbM family methyltransferase